MGKFPVNSEEHVKISKDLDLYVEEHAGKSIKFGLLESTGIFYRKLDYFYLNEEWINNLKIYHFKFDNHKNFFKLLSLSNVKKSFFKDEILEINYKILDTKIKLNNNIKINLFNNFNLIFKIENIEIIDGSIKAVFQKDSKNAQNDEKSKIVQIKYDIRAHFDVVTDIQFIDSTQMIVSTSEDCLVKLWNIKNI
jgi:WD40 repeat protein